MVQLLPCAATQSDTRILLWHKTSRIILGSVCEKVAKPLASHFPRQKMAPDLPWLDKEDREVKEAIIDAVTDEIFYDVEGPF